MEITSARKMKRIFRLWWDNLSPEEQDRIHAVLYEQYAEAEGIKVEDIHQHLADIKERQEATARAKSQGE